MAKKKKTFEEKLERLEEIVAILDDSETTLEDMLKVYEEGINLTNELRDFLEKAELKIKELEKEEE
jgi:exodeoxyribonuclease VII small subunit